MGGKEGLPVGQMSDWQLDEEKGDVEREPWGAKKTLGYNDKPQSAMDETLDETDQKKGRGKREKKREEGREDKEGEIPPDLRTVK